MRLFRSAVPIPIVGVPGFPHSIFGLPFCSAFLPLQLPHIPFFFLEQLCQQKMPFAKGKHSFFFHVSFHYYYTLPLVYLPLQFSSSSSPHLFLIFPSSYSLLFLMLLLHP